MAGMSSGASEIRDLLSGGMGTQAGGFGQSSGGMAAGGSEQVSMQSMTIGELAWWNTVLDVVKVAAPIVISFLETPAPAAGGMGQQSTQQFFRAMESGQVSVQNMTISQLGWFSNIFKKAVPVLINVAKQIISSQEAMGVRSSSIGSLSAQAGASQQDFDQALQAVNSGSFSIENMTIGQLGILDTFTKYLGKAMNGLGDIIEILRRQQAPSAMSIGQQDFWSGFMDVVGKAVKVAPDVVKTVGQIVQIVNQFSSQSTSGSMSSSSILPRNWFQNFPLITRPSPTVPTMDWMKSGWTL